ncbi:lipid IV(A) 3-deoxy-D-manno-octulosonic acid transferase [Rickettsiella endosymbiont of Litargus connexus]|jgi:3-deoxy-D-manno-octulosonic-acid transferase|uniref:lipid IV(A) 3-deoxy-D-manno-octulosonic acid transferase n=1 Tax=Rickettsiella endosymbiont of Litargus connexus TaxID=3066237 RepID=UPI00376EF709|nr:lipid IV(A) 3-deoxy-D-manno-octulosonic acid transferase [Gammaproteobacteria bacterium]
MRFLYTIIFYLFLPFILLRLWIKNRKNPNGLQFWHERLGLGLRHPLPSGGIWVHAVSVGESLTAIPLIKRIQQRYPSLPIIVTNETATGAERIRVALGNSITPLYFPYDLPLILRKFFKALQPKLLILLETELWPNLLAACQLYQVPVALVNARLSERSALSYRRILPITQAMLKSINVISAQFQADAERFIDLGFSPERIHITGSLKFDVTLPRNLLEQAQQWQKIWGENRLVWIAASTHPGEEELILQVFKQVRHYFPDLLLVSIPRHVHRASQLEQLYRSQNYNINKRSDHKRDLNDIDVLIGDTMGELLIFYAAADLGFVGGSLVEKGGQNPLEPAAVGLPILTGPYTFNFATITEQLKQRNAAIQVNNATELAEQVISLLSDPVRRQNMGREAKKFVEENKGSVLKQMQLIESLLII